MDEYQEMLKRANKKYKYSELEMGKITSLLDYCHATDVCMMRSTKVKKLFLRQIYSTTM